MRPSASPRVGRATRAGPSVAGKIDCRSEAAATAYPSDVSNTNMWTPTSGAGSEATVVEVFSAWLGEQGWTCAELPSYGDFPDIDARHPDGRHLVVEAKGFTRDAGVNLDVGYGQLLRRMTGDPATTYALVVAATVVRFAQRVPSEVRSRLGIALYTVDFNGQVELVDGEPL